MKKAVDDIPQRPDEAAHLGEAPFVFMQQVDHLAGRSFQQLVLEFLDGSADVFEHGVVVVDDRVEQGVGEVVRLELADRAAAGADAGADGIEHVILGLLLHGDDEVFPEKQAHLLAADGVAIVLIDHLGDDEEVVGRLLDFRALAGVEDVFEGERVELEFLAEDSEGFHVAEAIDVDPGDLAVVEMAG